MDEESSKSFEHSVINSSDDIIMDLDNNIKKLFNNLTIEGNKDIKTNCLNNKVISNFSFLDTIEKKYNVDGSEILNNPKPNKRKFYYPKEDDKFGK